MLNFGVQEVIGENFCIGCGACTVKSPAAKIEFNPFGELVADVSDCESSEISLMDQVCPFSSVALNETELARIAFANEATVQFGPEIGIFTGLYAGYSNSYRKFGSSGGIVTWLLSELLRTGKVDKVIVVGKSVDGDRFFDFKMIDNPSDLSTTGTSFYYPVSYDGALKYIMENPGRYAITGVPCFHKALRQLKLTTPILAERVVYQIGIVCGQMKSSFYLEYLSRKTGGKTSPVNACFRRKDESARADNYLFEASFKTASGEIETRSVRNREIGSNWAMGLFKPRACDYCDDVFAETADIAVMDAWLDQYVADGKGTSLIITRSAALQLMLDEGKNSGELHLEESSESNVVESQRGGLNHRRAGLRYRAFLDEKKGPLPTKRVLPSASIDGWFKIEQRIRASIRQKSRLAMKEQLRSGQLGLAIYDSKMKMVLGAYKWFGRLKSRVAKRHDYKPLFKLDR